MSEPPSGSAARPPKRKGAKPRARKPDDDIPKGKLPERLRKRAKPAKAVAADAWDPAAEAAAAKAAVVRKSGRKATVPIDPPVDVELRKKLETPRGSGSGKRSKKAADPVAAPAPAPAKTILGEVAREGGSGVIARLATLREKSRVTMTEEIFEDILLLLADGILLREILRQPGMPSKSGFYKWLDDDSDPEVHRGRLTRYGRAREMGRDEIAEESLEIVDDGTNDFVERTRDDGTTEIVVDRENIQRSKLRAEHRLKLLGVWDPIRYGNQIKLSDPNGRPLDRGGMSTSDMAIGIAKLVAAAQAAPAAQKVIEG